MKKKFLIMLVSCFLAFILTSCDEVLSVVTANEKGEKVVNNYISMFENTVYDDDISLSSWKEIELFDDDEVVDMEELLFKIENKTEKLLVLGDKESAVEISFFEGGYKYKVFSSMDAFNNMFDF